MRPSALKAARIKKERKKPEEIVRDWREPQVNCKEYLNNPLSSSGKVL